jgi:hypothetical protein
MAFTYPVTIINSNINLNQVTNPPTKDTLTYDLSSQIATAIDNTFTLPSNPNRDTFILTLDGLILALDKDYQWLSEIQFKLFADEIPISSESTILAIYKDI